MNTSPRDRSGGSAIEVVGPCASGTTTLRAFRADKGVRLVETLTGTGYERWEARTFITPQADDEGDTEPPVYTADASGVVTITADNRDNAGRARRAWPQPASVDDLRPTNDYALLCNGRVYLGSHVEAGLNNMSARVDPGRGKVEVSSTSFDVDGA